MMLRIDTIHRYQPFDHFHAHCRLRIYQHQERAVVIVTEMADNKEFAITSYWPELAFELATLYELDPADTIWIEHYPQGDYALASERGDTFDQLTLTDELPQWQRLSQMEVEALVGESIAENQ
ncbi:MAG TPA: hypothetical protein P5121_08770 [Caldilineaceae bacterium]|nr:hypothetical protein [Caldilineaceae bacterium]